MWTLKDSDLIGIAFIDTHIYIHQLVTLKSLIFAADIQKSVTVYRYQEEERVLSQVCRVRGTCAINPFGYKLPQIQSPSNSIPLKITLPPSKSIPLKFNPSQNQFPSHPNTFRYKLLEILA